MVNRQERFALLSRFKKLCKDHGYLVPPINMNVEQWSADALIESYGLAQCYDLLDYFFSINTSPTWNKFAQSAGRLIESRQSLSEDIEFRLAMRKRAEAWLQG